MVDSAGTSAGTYFPNSAFLRRLSSRGHKTVYVEGGPIPREGGGSRSCTVKTRWGSLGVVARAQDSGVLSQDILGGLLFVMSATQIMKTLFTVLIDIM